MKSPKWKVGLLIDLAFSAQVTVSYDNATRKRHPHFLWLMQLRGKHLLIFTCSKQRAATKESRETRKEKRKKSPPLQPRLCLKEKPARVKVTKVVNRYLPTRAVKKKGERQENSEHISPAYMTVSCLDQQTDSSHHHHPC